MNFYYDMGIDDTAPDAVRLDCKICGAGVTIPKDDLAEERREQFIRAHGHDAPAADGKSAEIDRLKARVEKLTAALNAVSLVLDVESGRAEFLQRTLDWLEEGWRPVTEPPDEDEGEDVELELLVAGAYRRGDGEFVDEFFGRPVRPTYYRVPRPAPKEGNDGDL